MKNLRLILLALCVLGVSAWGQEKPKSYKTYALPSSVRVESDPVVSAGGNPLMLSEAGTVPAESGQYACNEPPGDDETGGVSYQLQRYVEKHNWEDYLLSQKLMGKYGEWKVQIEEGYKGIPDPDKPTDQGFIKKSPLSFEDIGGAEAASWTITLGCVQQAHNEKTISQYLVHWVHEPNVVNITSGGHISLGTAKKLAQEVLVKLKALDYSKIK